jgi:hypothetical protein
MIRRWRAERSTSPAAVEASSEGGARAKAVWTRESIAGETARTNAAEDEEAGMLTAAEIENKKASNVV